MLPTNAAVWAISKSYSFLSHKESRTIAWSVDAIRPSIELGGRCEAEAYVVVPILWRVVVAICNATIRGVVVPTAAAIHTVRTLWRLTL